MPRVTGCPLPLTTAELRSWHRRATQAMETSNDAEHDALVEIAAAVEAALGAAEDPAPPAHPQHG